MDEAVPPAGCPKLTALRRAAGGTDPGTFAVLAAGFDAASIDGHVDASGKSAIMLAAWRGHIDNVRLLVSIGCDVNAIATGEFSYGP